MALSKRRAAGARTNTTASQIFSRPARWRSGALMMTSALDRAMKSLIRSVMAG